jgi:hypothetical protein
MGKTYGNLIPIGFSWEIFPLEVVSLSIHSDLIHFSCGVTRSVFENSVATKNSEASKSVAFYKIRKKSAKFGRNAFDERKEHDFF